MRLGRKASKPQMSKGSWWLSLHSTFCRSSSGFEFKWSEAGWLIPWFLRTSTYHCGSVPCIKTRCVKTWQSMVPLINASVVWKVHRCVHVRMRSLIVHDVQIAMTSGTSSCSSGGFYKWCCRVPDYSFSGPQRGAARTWAASSCTLRNIISGKTHSRPLPSPGFSKSSTTTDPWNEAKDEGFREVFERKNRKKGNRKNWEREYGGDWGGVPREVWNGFYKMLGKEKILKLVSCI